MMVIVIWILLSIYALMISIVAYGWSTIPMMVNDDQIVEATATVLIPVRDEADNIQHLLEDLALQDFPKQSFEVIVIDDHSSDNTKDIVTTFAETCNYHLKLLPLTLPSNFKGSHKKEAITQGIANSKNEIIVCTDGDCRVGKYWLSSMVKFVDKKKAAFVAGPVQLCGDNSFWGKLQELEFMGLIATGAASMQLGKPNMCNGANMAFTKKNFHLVGGYEGYSHIHSGDDEFLLAKIFKKWPDNIFFIKDPQVIVKTLPKQNLMSFVNQRKRWAGKWKYHKGFMPKFLAVFIFMINFMLFLAVIMAGFRGYSMMVIGIQVLFKFLIDYFLMMILAKFYKKTVNPLHILLLELIYPLYAVFFGLLSNLGGYKWKGRTLNN